MDEMFDAFAREAEIKESHFSVFKTWQRKERMGKPDGRWKSLCKFSRWFLCFKKGQRSFQCRSKSRCRYCKGKHNSLICTHNITNAEKEMQQLRMQTPLLNPKVKSLVGSASSSSASCVEEVALQTALARVEGEEKSRVRVLYESGRQKKFKSAKVANELDLKPLREEMLSIKKFRESEPEIKKRDV